MDETIIISKCCRREAIEDFKDNPIDKDNPIPIYICPKCKQECEVETVCAYCLGTGEINTMEEVYPGEPYMASIGTQTCYCQRRSNDDDEE